MTINLYDILQQVLTENVSPNEVIDAIDNKLQVVINYSDEKNRAPEKRLIEPYVYGLSRAGNAVFRAYQYEGDTFRGKPKWKLFRLDRVTSWQPTENHFNAEPRERGWGAEAYNENGDNSMATVLNQVNFDYDTNSNNPYTKDSDVYNIRKRTDNIKQSTPIKIDDLSTGPIIGKETQQNIAKQNKQDSQAFKDMLARNLEITRKEKEKRGFSLSNNTSENPTGPIIPQNQTANDGNALVKTSTTNQDDQAFKDMLARNLERTRKEKEKRGFKLS